MGGWVTLAIRFPDGEVVSQKVHTNPMSGWLSHPRAMKGDREFLNLYLAESGPNPFGVAPHGYGLVVLDFVSNRLMTMQDYHRFGNLMPSTVSQSSFRQDDLHDEKLDLWLSENRLQEKFVENDEWALRPLNGKVTDRESLKKHCSDLSIVYTPGGGFASSLTLIQVDYSPLWIIPFDQTARSCGAFLSMLHSLSFNISPSEHSHWAAFAARLGDE